MNLYQHQKDACNIGVYQNLAMFHDPGTGKTISALSLINYWRNLGIGPACVVCPLSIITPAWIADCQQHFPHLSIVSLWQKASTKKRQIQLKILAGEHDIFVCNFETFKSLHADLTARKFGVLVVDESSKIKNYKSGITHACLAMAGIHHRGSPYRVSVVPHRYALSGTPAPNDESEYWAQVKFITGNNNDAFNSNFFAFRGRYFHGVQLGSTRMKLWKFRQSMRQRFMDAMKPFTHVVRKADALDLPDQIHQIRSVHLGTREQAAYNRMKKELVLQFRNDLVLSQTALTEIMKLRQLTSGFVYGEETHVIGQSKMKELQHLLGEIGDQQVIIWCNFKEEVQQLLEALKGKAAAFGGKQDERNLIIERFKAGAVQYLVANPQSAGHGLSFSNCGYAVYYSMSYSYELMKQSQDRIHGMNRGLVGQHSLYYYLLAHDTIDEVIYKAVARKGELSNTILTYLKGKSWAKKDQS